MWTLVERNGLADDVGISSEAAAPQTVAQDHHAFAAVVGISGNDPPSDARPHAEDIEEIIGHVSGRRPLRFVGAGYDHGTVHVCAKCLEGCRLVTVVGEIRVCHARHITAESPPVLDDPKQVNEPIGLLEGQGPDEKRIDDRENRDVRSDAERQGDHRERGESEALAQRPGRKANVLPEAVHHRFSYSLTG